MKEDPSDGNGPQSGSLLLYTLRTIKYQASVRFIAYTYMITES